MTDLTRALELIELAQELDAKATSDWESHHIVPELARLLAEQIAATEAAEAKLASAEKVIEAARALQNSGVYIERPGDVLVTLLRDLDRALAAHDAAPMGGE